MGLIDKFKNLFTDEEIIEEEVNDPIEIKEIKKEEEVHKLPTFMRERLENEEKEIKVKKDAKFNFDDVMDLDFELKSDYKSETKKVDNDNKKNDDFLKLDEKKSFKFPLEFSDDDFVETRSSRYKTREQNINMEEPVTRVKNQVKEKPELEKPVKTVKKESTKVSNLYKEKKQEEKKFRATPIISPIYGVLNKNYNSDEVACVKGENLEEKRHSKNVDFDSVRKKAYGNLSKEIKENLMCENCEYLKEAKECQRKKEKEVKENIVYEALNNDLTEEYDYYSNITLDEATENYYDHGVEYEKTLKPRVEKDYMELEDDIIINNHDEEIDGGYVRKSPPPVKSSINLLSTLKKSAGEEEKNLELTDDLFNLIDSMYDERND